MKNKRKKRLAILSGILAALAITVAIPGGSEKFRDAAASIIPSPSPNIIDLPANPSEMGKAHGRSFPIAVRLLESMYIKRIICGGNDKNFSEYTEKAAGLFAKIDSRWTSEIRGLAQAAGADEKSLMLGNCFLDMGITGTACRQLVISNEKLHLHAHNLDWDNLGGFANYLVTAFRTSGGEGRLATVYFGFPGMIGALDVINEKGISLSFNQVANSKGTDTLPIFMKMREIAEKCPDFERAKKEIVSMAPGMPFCIGLSDAESGKASVFERDIDMRIKERPMTKGILSADNNLWANRSMKGSCRIDDAARMEKPNSIKGVEKILRREDVMMECNIYSLILDYRNNSFYLASGKVPAALHEYRKYTLFN